ncbi:MAG: hypothetical protein RR643_04525 [Anaerorhabdus sp.]|uniref:glycerophosphodiester phosphodiesterase family protein n=1 Tax=Anaerorhabdus sp. TaxID=1872524 RepID=UPI002FC6B862
MKNKQNQFLIILAIFLAICCVGYYFVSKSKQYPEANLQATPIVTDNQSTTLDWSREYRVMAHAMGGIDNHDYTNSLEAFEYNYGQGTRLFEIDLETTLEGDICLAHTWEDFRTKLTNIGGDIKEPLSNEEFKNAKIYDKYTPLFFKEVLEIMQEKQDFYLIIDSKMFDVEGTRIVYDKLMEVVNEVDPELITRIIPQAYNPEIIDVLQQEYEFPEIIYTLYSIYDKSNGEEIYKTVKEKGIRVVVMHMDNDWAEKVIQGVVAYAINDNDNRGQFNVYIHTVNDTDKAREIVNDYHFFGIYSDFITENQFNKDILINK